MCNLLIACKARTKPSAPFDSTPRVSKGWPNLLKLESFNFIKKTKIDVFFIEIFYVYWTGAKPNNHTHLMKSYDLSSDSTNFRSKWVQCDRLQSLLFHQWCKYWMMFCWPCDVFKKITWPWSYCSHTLIANFLPLMPWLVILLQLLDLNHCASE